MKIIKFIWLLLKDFIIKTLKEIGMFLVFAIVGTVVFGIISIIPIVIAYLTQNSFLFILAYPLQMMIIDVVSNRKQSESYYKYIDIKNYFKTKWNEIK